MPAQRISRRRVALGLVGLTASAATPNRQTGWTPPRIFDIEQPWPWIKDYRRTAIRLHPELSAAPLPPAASKLGGTFLWPSRERWPYCTERDQMADEMPRHTWDQWLVMQRETKLSMSLTDRVALPKPTGNVQRDMAAMERESKKLEQEFERRKAAGLPQLTAAELAEAKKSFEENNQLMAMLKLPHNTPYLAVMQRRRDEFPELPWPGSADLFQLLWCPRLHLEANGWTDPDDEHPPQQSPGFVVKWRTEKLVGPVIAKPPQQPQGRPGLGECRLHPEEIVEYPQATEFDYPDMQRRLPALAPWFASAPARARSGGRSEPDLHWRYSHDVAAAPGTKLFGYPFWWQDDGTPECVTCGERMKLLVSCSCHEEADNPIWAPPARLNKPEYNNPSGQSWGDLSSAYLFYCNRRRHPLRLKTVIQST